MQFSDSTRHKLTMLLGEAGAVVVEIALVVAVPAIALLAGVAVLVAIVVADILALKHALGLSGIRGSLEQSLILTVGSMVILVLVILVLFWALNQHRKLRHARHTEYDWEEPEEVEDSSDQDNCWIILGVSPDASLNDIRRNYRRKILQYHPDRVAGLAPAVRELAETRSKRLNAAYAEAMRKRRLSP
jgi:hypothetical protein